MSPTLRWLLPAILAVTAGPALAEVCSPVPGAMREDAGLQAVEVAVGAAKVDLRMVRVSPRQWRLHVFDMRELRRLRVRKGDYRAPAFSLDDLADARGGEGVYSSAGATGSLSLPAPVGLLKVNGDVVNAANPTSRILDGLVCVRQDGVVELRSEDTPQGRRIPQTRAGWDDCRHAVQAGPMLLDEGASLVKTRGEVDVPRVFIALDGRGQFVLGHAGNSRSFDLACALTSAELGLRKALMLQSHHLGGIVFGAQSGWPAATWGHGDGTIASALELHPLKQAAPAGSVNRRR